MNDIYDRLDSKTFNIDHVLQVKNSRHTLVIVQSSMAKHSINIIIGRKIPTAVHRGRK